ncbi:hypothetical protein ONZ45_g18814 [Pleurotus djamor]|nr:hypothetical protein ONZ45_g18814 [Pleurotus djamor]
MSNTGGTRSKRQRSNKENATPLSEPLNETDSAPAIGYGPVHESLESQAEALHPVFTSKLFGRERKTSWVATDIWNAIRPVPSASQDACSPLEDDDKRWSKQPTPAEGSHLACRYCEKIGKWHAWRNVDGQNKTIRNHMRNAHWKEYRDDVHTNDLKVLVFKNPSLEKDFKIAFSDGLLRMTMCFPHVINIAVKTGLKYMTSISDEDPEVSRADIEELFPESTPTPSDYQRALKTDLIGRVRKLVNAIRASGQRRQGLKEVIDAGNLSHAFSEEIKALNLIRDVDTRWSAIYLMIERFLYLHPAVKIYIMDKTELQHHSLSPLELRILNDILKFLLCFHAIQQVVSAEKTPTLCLVLPLYDDLIQMLESLNLPELQHAISAAIQKLKEYLAMAQTTRLYTLAMAINPTMKFKWLAGHREEERTQAKGWFHDALLVYQRDQMRQSRSGNPSQPSQSTGTRRPNRSQSTPAALAQRSALQNVKRLKRALTEELRPVENSNGGVHDQVPASTSQLEEQINTAVVDAVNRWVNAGVIEDEEELETFDLMQYWSDKANQSRHPLIFRLALDVLPIPASAVPCERVFSSGKETDALRRSRLSPLNFEILQIMKFMYRSERLPYGSKFIAREEDTEDHTDTNPSDIENLLSSLDTSSDTESLVDFA